ncbi:hypothetical protein DS745_11310 [Anaerobacillus alkaliphilus]|uniref:Staygreen protein domain-containing protein n=1 Tax=Anaerobacillus alkaliphilus TaxID=1548597 RepID=A0A4Q0VS71_9BACI|nr:staygreen family protein [Anaerobacillus alkaliphilus]RXJ00643.1 hypothetical protein DS745_11310 [Anaerobacillus alkaliphilus]
MSNFDLEKLSVTVYPPVTSLQPVVGRKYTLTHSDDTGMLFLDIGSDYNYQAINTKMRDEVLAEWQVNKMMEISLVGFAYVDSGEYSKEEAEFRLTIFHKEMETALKGIINGDHFFLLNYPMLLDAPIFIYFQSVYPGYHGKKYFGTPRDYLFQ